jgi:hypothetical protein
MALQHSYEVLVDMIPRIYDTQRIIRIKKFDDKEEMIEINKTVTDEQSGRIVKIYDLSMGKYDVAVDIGASYTTQRQMASESMMELIQYAPQLAGTIMDLIAKNLDWPGADEIAERLADKRPNEQQMQQIIGEAVGKAMNSEKMQVEKFKAKTQRMKTVADIMTDDDQTEIELLKLLEANGVSDEVLQTRAIDIINRMGEQLQTVQQAEAQQLLPPQPQQPQQQPQQGQPGQPPAGQLQ